MKRTHILFIMITTIILSLSGCKKSDAPKNIVPDNTYVALTDQSNSRVDVFDISGGIIDQSTLKWSADVPSDGVADAKLRNSKAYGKVAIATCGADGYGCMISYPDGKLLWSTNSAAQNPHAIELMPNGIIAIASSAGNEVRFFKTKGVTYSEDYDASMGLIDAHGLIWDSKREVLWALGNKKLTAYSFEFIEGEISVTEQEDLTFSLPTSGGHDLAVDYQNENSLLISTSKTSYRFDIESGTFTDIFADFGDIKHSGIKGIGTFTDGSLIYIRPDKQYKSWTSASLNTVQNGEVSTITSSLGHYYKCRIWSDQYR